MNILIGADHGGYKLKEDIKSTLKGKGHLVDDYSKEFIEGDDYPDVARSVAHSVDQQRTLGILICRTGIGTSIAANKVSGARAAVCRSVRDARMARADNDANILCLGADVTSPLAAHQIVNVFLSTEFLGNKDEGSRHLRRVNKIEMMEKR